MTLQSLRACLALWCCALAGLAQAQQPFEVFPPEAKAKYHIDFPRLFFATREEERADYKRLEAMLDQLDAFRGEVSKSPEDLLRALELNGQILTKQALHDAYLYVRYAVNTKDEASKRDDDALNAEVPGRTAAFDEALRALPGDRLANFARVEPRLEPYMFEIGATRRSHPYTLAGAEEKRLAGVAPFVSGWQSDLYETILGQTRFPTLDTPEGKMDVWKDRNRIALSTNRAVREAGFKQRWAAFGSQRDLYAFALLNTVRARNALSRAHHYEDFADEVFFGRYLTVAGMSNLLEEVAAHADVYKRYQRLRAEHARAIGHYGDVNVWDVGAVSSGTPPQPRFSIDDARELILRALKPLGPAYGAEMAQLLDPENGRLDIVPGENRLAAGGGVGFPGIPNVFYANGFNGTYKDLSVLIHEGGHVVHYQLMGANHVKPAYGAGPNYFSESFSILNELLLADYLNSHETDPARRLFFLEQFFEVKGMEVFRAAHDAALELAIYRGVDSGTIEDADGLDGVTERMDSQYSIWAGKHAELKGQWMAMRLMYEDPLYLSNYLLGGALALRYFQALHEDPQGFSVKYIALMRNGFTDTPERLLQSFLGIDFAPSKLLADDLKVLSGKLDDLERLYAESEQRPARR